MEIKTPIAELHAKEVNVGFTKTSSNSNKIIIWSIVAITVIAAAYFIYQNINEDKKA